MSDPFELVLSRVDVAREEKPGQWQARCPAHDDQEASLSIGPMRDHPGAVGIDCKARCRTADVLDAIGLTFADLFPRRADGAAQRPPRPAPKPKAKPKGKKPPRKEVRSEIQAVYDYRRADGELAGQVLRKWVWYDDGTEGKTFRQRHPSPEGGWIWRQWSPPTLYRLPELLEGTAEGRRVYLVEGEKDADRLRAGGLLATTNPMGAGKWEPEYTEALRGAEVVILPDNDDPGRAHAEGVARALEGVADLVRVVELDGLPPKGDVSDWLDAGGTIGDLDYRAGLTPPVGGPPPSEPPAPPADEPPPIRGPLRSWAVVGGQLVKWRQQGETRVAESMFRGVPSLARICTRYAEDPDHPGEWLEEEELTYRFDLLGRPAVVRRCGPGRAAFLKLLDQVRLDAATDALDPRDRAKLHKWAIERCRPEEVSEVCAVGPHGDRGWIAPPAVRVRDGEVLELPCPATPPCDMIEFRRFRLDRIGTGELRDTARWIVAKLLRCDLADQRYTLPLLGAFLAAPLWEYLPTLADWQRYALFVQGTSGVGKSTLCRYFWCFWGDFRNSSGLTTWSSSATYIEQLLYEAKAVPVCIGDWKRAAFNRDQLKDSKRLLQGYADKASRGRAKQGTSTADRKKPPRCSLVIDGEDLPEGEQSTLGRLVILKVAALGPDNRCANASDAFLAREQVARLPGVTARWIAWVQRCASELDRELADVEQELSDSITAGQGVTQRSRLVRNYAVQVLTVRAFLRFLGDEAGLAGLESLAAKSTAVHVEMAQAQLASVSGEAYGEQFMSALCGLLASGDATLRARWQHSGPEPFKSAKPTATQVGLYHQDTAYVYSTLTLATLERLGRAPAASASAILAQLKEQGIVKSTPRLRDGGERLHVWEIDLQDLAAERDEGMFGGGDE